MDPFRQKVAIQKMVNDMYTIKIFRRNFNSICVNVKDILGERIETKRFFLNLPLNMRKTHIHRDKVKLSALLII